MECVAVIMAGGIGERLWPLSRRSFPKQFIALLEDNETMIQKTVNNISDIIPHDNIYIVTNITFRNLITEQLPSIPNDNIILESEKRNTAPCIGVAAELIQKRYGDAIMVMLPSDHLISDKTSFLFAIQKAIEIVSEGDSLFTIGLPPTYPETGYGYMKIAPNENDVVFPVEEFIEKPSYDLANSFIESGDYLWNSGIFIWKASSILLSFQVFLPNIFSELIKLEGINDINDFNSSIQSLYRQIPSISIDKGVMEKSKNVYTIQSNFGWNDIGSWLTTERIINPDNSNNHQIGNAISIGCNNCIIRANKRLVAAMGLDDCIIIDTNDVTLVCKKTDVHKIKDLLNCIEESNRTEFL